MTPLLRPGDRWQQAVRRARLSVFLTVAASLAIALYLGWKEGYLRPSESFHVEAPSSRSISKGMAVHLSGFKIGQVDKVTLQPDRNVRVELAIYAPYLDFIKADSEVVLEAGALIEDPSLEITGGSSTAANAAPGSRLPFRRQSEWSDQIGEVIDRVEPVIESMDALFLQARAPDGEVQTTLKNLAESTARLEGWIPGFLERTDATLAKLEQAGELATETLTPLGRSDGDLRASLRAIRATTTDLEAELPILLAELKTLVASLRSTATTLESSVNEFAPRLPALVEQGSRTARGAGEVVDAVKDFSLIRGRIDETAPPPLLPTTQP